jgi:hypothetical protein
VEYMRAEPLGFSFVTNVSYCEVLRVVSNAPGVVGKSPPLVRPVTYALPAASTAIAHAASAEGEPRYVEYSSPGSITNGRPGSCGPTTKP